MSESYKKPIKFLVKYFFDCFRARYALNCNFPSKHYIRTLLEKKSEVIRVNIDDDQFAGSCGGRVNSQKISDLGTTGDSDSSQEIRSYVIITRQPEGARASYSTVESTG